MIAGDPGYIQYSLDKQRSRLGLDKKTLSSLEGKRVLDIGCGADAKLVGFLRTRGVEAEGIDPLVKEERPYLIRAAVNSILPGQGGISRPDNHYDLVVSQGNSTLRVFTDFIETDMAVFNRAAEVTAQEDVGARVAFKQDNQLARSNAYLYGVLMLSEMLRVVKPEGRIVIYPGFTKLSSTDQLINPKNLVMYRQSTGFKEQLIHLVEQGKFDQLLSSVGELEGIIDSAVYRTVFSSKVENEDRETGGQFLERLRILTLDYPKTEKRIPFDSLVKLSKETLGVDPVTLATIARYSERKPTQQTIKRDSDKVGRNESCPCGSGKKYKRCCG